MRGISILDARLAASEYVGGDAFTLADIPLCPIAHRFFSLDIERPESLNVRRWYDALSARGGVKKWVLIAM